MAKEPKLHVKPETIIKKIETALDGLNDLMGYLKSKKHDQDILNIRQIFPLFSKLFDAQDLYKKQLKTKKTMEWKLFDGAECPKCGGACEVNTVSQEQNWIYDDEDAKCVDCGLGGHASCDGEIADIIWDDYETETHDTTI